MKKLILIGIAVIFAAVSLLSCADGSQNTTNSSSVTRNSLPSANGNSGNSAMNSNTMNGNSATSMNDNRTGSVQDNFWTNAAQSGMAEVELGKIASTKAQNPEVKKFAQMMVTDHTKSNMELKTLAAKNSVTLPTGLDSAHQSMMEKLNGMSGADFDKAYVEGQVEDHETAVSLMGDNTNNDNADVKTFATKSLPIMKSHLEMIKGIQSKMK